jgi:uncharacterized small protein (DUF1192 family)
MPQELLRAALDVFAVEALPVVVRRLLSLEAEVEALKAKKRRKPPARAAESDSKAL